MRNDDIITIVTNIADGELGGEEWEGWLIDHPEAALDVETMRRVRAIVGTLRAQESALPPDFERRLLAAVAADTTLLNLIDLGLSGIGRALLELLAALFSFAPATQNQQVA